eukprot:1363352-Rhodomonas_salina.1
MISIVGAKLAGIAIRAGPPGVGANLDSLAENTLITADKHYPGYPGTLPAIADVLELRLGGILLLGT